MEKRVPLFYRIKRKNHAEIARLQDMVIEIIYRTMSRAVLHGGTAIWRCYSGSRFSDDIDMYLEKNEKAIENFFNELKSAGFSVSKREVGENSIYSVIELGGVTVRFEAVFKKVLGIVKEYETYEGMLMNVYTLLPEELILEKISAYEKRRKIRDLFDIFFLLRYADNPGKIRTRLKAFVDGFTKPVDEGELKVIVLFGAIPSRTQMLDYIKRWLG